MLRWGGKFPQSMSAIRRAKANMSRYGQPKVCKVRLSGSGSGCGLQHIRSGLLEEGAETPGCVFVASSKKIQEAKKWQLKLR